MVEYPITDFALLEILALQPFGFSVKESVTKLTTLYAK
jgi:hypothetical protein